jgi:hypothetical protein
MNFAYPDRGFLLLENKSFEPAKSGASAVNPFHQCAAFTLPHRNICRVSANFCHHDFPHRCR